MVVPLGIFLLKLLVDGVEESTFLACIVFILRHVRNMLFKKSELIALNFNLLVTLLM